MGNLFEADDTVAGLGSRSVCKVGKASRRPRTLHAIAQAGIAAVKFGGEKIVKQPVDVFRYAERGTARIDGAEETRAQESDSAS